MIPSFLRRSLRARLATGVLLVAVVPPLLVGAWVIGFAERSGTRLLVDRLQSAAEADAVALESAWVSVRSRILDIAESDAVRTSLETPANSEATVLPDSILPPSITYVEVRDVSDRLVARGGAIRTSIDRPEGVAGQFEVEVPVYRGLAPEPVGRLAAGVPSLELQAGVTLSAAVGGLRTIRDPSSGAVFLPFPLDPGLLAAARFEFDGETWLVGRAAIDGPGLEIVHAAPLDPFLAPFAAAARSAALILAAIVLGAALLVWVASGRLTAALRRVEEAAGSVAGGELDQVVPVEGEDEIARLATSFNRMSASLRATLRRLSDRESLAAVNEFAAALAHEIRNPLTHIRLDLQEVEERLDADSEVRHLQSRALEDLGRLNDIVEGALGTARSGHVDPVEVDVSDVLRTVDRASRPAASEQGVALEFDLPVGPVHARVDPGALERAVLNLVLNAIQFSPTGAIVEVDLRPTIDGLGITVADRGPGVEVGEERDAFDAFVTTRAGGTGVGLGIARRIARAHGGDVSLHPRAGGGTVATLRVARTGGGAPDRAEPE